ncbi:MAG: hypothetical protein ABI592_06700 [Acidobacteriota bacterium]
MRKATRALLCLALGLAVTPLFAAGKDFEGTPQAKVYRANQKAIATGDYEAYKKTMSSEALKEMDSQTKAMGKQPKDIMELMKMMSPTDIKITDVKVDGKKAVLSVNGKSDGQMMKGTADMVDENGGWKMGKQSWSNK